jgi:hypothetical protein
MWNDRSQYPVRTGRPAHVHQTFEPVPVRKLIIVDERDVRTFRVFQGLVSRPCDVLIGFHAICDARDRPRGMLMNNRASRFLRIIVYDDDRNRETIVYGQFVDRVKESAQHARPFVRADANRYAINLPCDVFYHSAAVLG